MRRKHLLPARGPAATGTWASAARQILGRLHPTEANRRAFIDVNIPIDYFGEPGDMTYLVAFLALPLAHYITGEVIHVDDGMHRFAGWPWRRAIA